MVCVKTMRNTKVPIAITVIILIFSGMTLFSIAFINNSPGLYKYSVDIEGLDNYQSGLITDIIVPIPHREGQPVFSDDELQYQVFGDWKSVIVVTPVGKMLAFQYVGGNLTNIHAVFYKKYPDGITVKNITTESFAPALPLVHSPYTQRISGSDPTSEFSTIIYIPDTIQPKQSKENLISINLNLLIDEGMQHSLSGKVYDVTVYEQIPAGIYNSIPVVVQILEK